MTSTAPPHLPPSMVLSISWQQFVLFSAAGLLATKLLQSYWAASSRRRKLPPGPKGSLLLGMTKEMLDPTTKPWTKFEKWSKECNAPHLLHVPTLSQTSIIVNSLQAAFDLLEKRPKIYSGRPTNVFDAEIVEGSMVLANIDQPDEVAKRRKLLNEDMGAQGCRSAQPVQLEEARKFAADLLHRPTEYLDCITQSQHSLVLRMTCSRITSMTPEQLWQHIQVTQSRPKPSLTPLLLLYPWLRHLPQWFPGANFREMGERYHRDDKKVWMSMLSDVRKDISQGTAQTSFVANWLESDAGKRYGLNETEMAFAAGNLLTAGGDLPDVTFRIFILTMLHHPEIAARARAEIDRVVGRDRLPSFEDKEDLPLTRAIILETQRWRPLSPIGICHVATEDDWYNGMFIPKGARFWPCMWALSRDESVYPEPERFLPERHLREDGSFTKRNELPTWGFGARKCSAMHLAEATLFINIATLLWAFDFVPPTDEDGKPVLPSTDYEDWLGVIPCAPPKFKVTCEPRGPEVEALLRVEVDGY